MNISPAIIGLCWLAVALAATATWTLTASIIKRTARTARAARAACPCGGC